MGLAASEEAIATSTSLKKYFVVSADCHVLEPPDLWERRIAILATFRFIREDDFDDTMRIAEMLLHDREDLIHKAVGWMLREVGKSYLD